LLLLSVLVPIANAQCSCDPGAIIINQGAPPKNWTFAPVTFTSSADGCDLTAHCTGYSPLALYIYYSRTAQGDTPILDPYNAAPLNYQVTNVIEPSSLDYKYMRCTNGNWMVYSAENDHLAINDPNCAPGECWMYNNIFCTQPLLQSPMSTNVPVLSTLSRTSKDITLIPTSHSIFTTHSSPTTSSFFIAKDNYCNCAIVDGWFDNWDPSEIWVDLVVILDTSASMGDSLEEAKSVPASFISLMSTDTSAEFYSRIGVIAVSDTVEVVYNLNMSSSDSLDSIKQHNVNKIDVVGAFRAALEMFSEGMESPSYRESAKQIIYFLTNSDPGSNMNGVENFKTDGGIIIVNDFVLEGQVANPGLNKLASENFYFTDLSENFVLSLEVFCEANCFCDSSKHAFNDDENSPRTQANRGCYHPVNNGIPQ
ncbi:hypothetical protein PENTCL1PPCAC_18722, partial [Pristionchus entomophagus]